MIDTRWTYAPDIVSAPGETLQELLDERGITQKDLAARMGRPIKTINEIVKGKAKIVPDTAVELERTLGLPASFWNEREAHYRGYLASVDADRRASRWLGWLDLLPLKEMMDAGALPRLRLTSGNRKALLDAALKFFGVASPNEWNKIYAQPQAAYRRTRKDQSDAGAIAAWLRLGELQAEQCDCETYDEQKFKDVITRIRALTVQPPEKFQPEMTRFCASAGVVLAFVPAIPRAHVSGAARWINRRAVIQLSLYGKTNDRFWFTFFHEAGHILKHARDEVFLDELTSSERNDPLEKEADRFAADTLVPPDAAASLSLLGSDSASVRAFATRIGIHPGIVVGRLQHEELIRFNSPLNNLKTSYRWIDTTSH